MILATKYNCTEVSIYNYTSEQDELGLGPKEWPERIETTLGNQQPFIKRTQQDYCATYMQGNGCISLTVYHV